MKKYREPLKKFKDMLLEDKLLTLVYVVLRAVVILALVMAVARRDYERTFVCVLVLALYMLPAIIQRGLKIELPTTLEIIILCFIFAAEILGELQNYYVQFEYWDTLLHTTSGFICAAIGFSLTGLLNRSANIRFQLSPIYMALVAFCFSMTVGVIWEFFEFGVDRIMDMDMQKDTVISAFSSVMLDETNSNIPIHVRDITDVTINGRDLGLGGYLDIGLYDTMEDLFVNFIGAVVFCTIGFYNEKSRGKSLIARQFIPRVLSEAEAKALEAAEDAPGDDAE